MSRKDDAVHTRTVATTQQRAQVARVGHTVDGHQERSLARPTLQQRVDGHRRNRIGVRQHALGSLTARGVFQLLTTDLHHQHAIRARQIADVLHHVALVQVGGQPHLVHAATTGDQQLAHRLTALDLTTTQIVVGLRCRSTTGTTSGRPSRLHGARLHGSGATGAACIHHARSARTGSEITTLGRLARTRRRCARLGRLALAGRRRLRLSGSLARSRSLACGHQISLLLSTR